MIGVEESFRPFDARAEADWVPLVCPASNEGWFMRRLFPVAPVGDWSTPRTSCLT